MPRFGVVGAALGLVAMLALHGCGGGGGSGGETTKTTTRTTTPGTTTSTTVRTGPGGLRYCEDIGTFYRVNEDDDKNEHAVGQCMPSKNPGAYYTKPGDKDPNDPKSDRLWMCFDPTFEKSLWTNEEARKNNFEGACLFEDFNSKVQPGDVEDCSKHLPHHPAVCSPGPSQYWGACWSSASEQWKCIPKKDPDNTIPGLAKGDCKAGVVLNEDGTPTKSFYDGACRFKKEKVVKYKCDTVPGYDSGDATTCGGGSPFDSACFTLNKGANWQCFGKDPNSTTPCDWTLLDGKKEFYRGACVFKSNDDYQNAADAHNLTAVVKSFFI